MERNFQSDIIIIKINSFSFFCYVVKGDNWSSVHDDITVVNEPLHKLKKNKIVCHIIFWCWAISGYLNMLELLIICYISFLFLKPHLNHPGQCWVTQASIRYWSKLENWLKFLIILSCLCNINFLNITYLCKLTSRGDFRNQNHDGGLV